MHKINIPCLSLQIKMNVSIVYDGDYHDQNLQNNISHLENKLSHIVASSKLLQVDFIRAGVANRSVAKSPLAPYFVLNWQAT